MSAAIKLKFGLKTFDAKLSIDAIERIESQFDGQSIPQLMVRGGGGIRVGKAILTACILEENPGMGLTLKQVHEPIDQDIEDNGIDSLWEKVKAMIDASGMYGKTKAKAAQAGN